METQQHAALLINPEPGTVKVLTDQLDQHGYNLFATSELDSITRELTIVAPDLIFLEWGNTNPDEFLALTREIAEYVKKGHSQLIVICESESNLIDRALNAGASDYIVRPLKNIRINKRIEALIRTHKSESHARHLVYHDALTGLPNRLLLVDRIEHAITRAETQNKLVAILMIDLDDFKLINDTLGHDCGDDLLAEVSQRLTGQIGELDTVARLGGDEFIILIESVESPAIAAVMAKRINELMTVPFSVDQHTLHLSCSTGIAMWPYDGKNIGRLLKHADTAMYKAKDSGKDQFSFYQSDMEEQVTERLSVSNDIRVALEKDEFIVFYQPQVDFKTGKLTGMEALVRWQHPDRGIMPPGVFLPVAEESGLIIPISDRVMEISCAQIKQWRDMGLDVPHVAVNLSTRHFYQPDLLLRIKRLLKKYQLQGSDLAIEITETTAMESPDAIIPVLNGLKELNIGLAIDDFGTGHSSLAYLKKFPVDTLKIDRIFVSDIQNGPDDEALVNGILSLANAFDLEVVAEGVETEEQANMLRTKGCQVAQGYLYSRPVDTDTMTTVLRAGYLSADSDIEAAFPTTNDCTQSQ